jgi:mercuric ion transport protein
MSDKAEHARAWSIGGALLAAFAASACCLGPLVLAALGIGGVGATAVLGAYRPQLLVGTALLLGVGFYFTYRKPRGASGAVCDCEHPRANRAGRLGLWIATVVVALVAAAPPLLAKWAEHARPKPDATAAANASTATATISVEGIDCEACAVQIRQALAKAGGFHDLQLDIPHQSITVTYEPTPGRLEAYVAAINELGYEAKLPAAGTVQP